MKNTDFDDDDLNFRQEIAPVLNQIRTEAGPCPHPDQLMAVTAGVLFDGAERIREHLAACSVCRQFSHDLNEYEHPELSDEEDRRIRARWSNRAPRTRPVLSWWTWLWRPIPMAGAAAVAAIVLVIGVFILREPPAKVNQTAGTTGTAESPTPVPVQPARTSFVLEKAPIKVAAAAVLTFRSDIESTQRFLKELASALEPYRMDDYPEAVRRLEILGKKYPKYIEPQYYLGVSRLMLNETESALASLIAARSLADESWRDNVSWYLALALDRAGRSEDARGEVETLCSRAGEFQQRACAAVKELRR